MGVFGVMLVCALHLPFAGAAAPPKANVDFSHWTAPSQGPDFKYQSFVDGWQDLDKTKKSHNRNFYAKIGAMAEAGENGVQTLKAKDGEIVLYYVVHESGEGEHLPKKDTKVEVHYKGATIDGYVFDNSFARDAPAEVFSPTLGGTFHTEGNHPNLEVLRGWKEALQQMAEGDVWELYIPHQNAYGDRGAGVAREKVIPRAATLVFILAMENIQGHHFYKVKKSEHWSSEL